MRIRPSAPLVAAIVLATWTTTVALASAATRSAVQRAQDSVVRVVKISDEEKNAAFVLDVERGNLLTTAGAVARSPEGVRVLIDGKRVAGHKVPSDAPPGLAVVHVPRLPSSLPALPIAEEQPSSARLWIVAPRGVLQTPRSAVLRLACDKTATLKAVEAARVSGMNGSPVLNDGGHVVGLVRKDQPDRCFTSAGLKVIQVLPVLRPPQQLKSVPPPVRSDFPAVNVVLVFGLALILANIALYWQRRRAIHDELYVAPPIAAPGPLASAPPLTDVGGDIEITLRPSRGVLQPPPPASPPDDPDDDIGPITLR